MPKVHIVDHVAGNVRSLSNAIERCGYEVEWVKTPKDIRNAEKLILPGVGHFGHCLTQLAKVDYLTAIKEHIDADKPFMGICVGFQALFDLSSESPNARGLGLIPLPLTKFTAADKPVPHIGWNDARPTSACEMYGIVHEAKYYYVHSYKSGFDHQTSSSSKPLESLGWHVATSSYGSETFIGAVARRQVLATQFHPEKSGSAGLAVLDSFLTGRGAASLGKPRSVPAPLPPPGLTRRIIACLDVRTDECGQLVVTKGNQYDVMEQASGGSSEREEVGKEKDTAKGKERRVEVAKVRNLGAPVHLAERYYAQGADEITFLNIMSFASPPLKDRPMLQILREAAKTIFVPLTVGGGIKDTLDPPTIDSSAAGQSQVPEQQRRVSALEVATEYFKSGADKVSIGSDAVMAAKAYRGRGRVLDGNTGIEQISATYGVQAVVVSVDPKRVYVANREAARIAAGGEHVPHVITTAFPGPQGEKLCYYACTTEGGRKLHHDLDVVALVTAVEDMGAGEILLNCIDRDGTYSGFDLELIRLVKSAVKIPVVASSGAGKPEHFAEVFRDTSADAALGAGIFHRCEWTVGGVKKELSGQGLLVREGNETWHENRKSEED